MSRTARVGAYVTLLILGLSLTPPHLFSMTLKMAIVGLFCMLLVQLRSTRNIVDEALAWVALWAVIGVLGSPFVPLWHNLGELLRGAVL